MPVPYSEVRKHLDALLDHGYMYTEIASAMRLDGDNKRRVERLVNRPALTVSDEVANEIATVHERLGEPKLVPIGDLELRSRELRDDYGVTFYRQSQYLRIPESSIVSKFRYNRISRKFMKDFDELYRAVKERQCALR